MQLNAEQKKTVGQWLASGASIADVQRRLREEFKLSLTYMDTRFLLDDLGLDVKSRPAAKSADLAAKSAAPAGMAPGSRDSKSPPPGAGAVDDVDIIDEGDAYAAGADEFAGADDEPSSGISKVKVDVDRITRPGTVVSGSVTFSDGNTGKWALDQLGRLVFEGSQPGYRPSQTDLQEFQRELSLQLQRHGY